MEKKIIIVFALAQILLIGSLIGIASSNYKINFVNDDVNNPSLDEDYDCNQQCNINETCNQNDKTSCDGSGSCTDTEKETKDCISTCSESGTCKQTEIQPKSCNTQSGCSRSCTSQE